VIGHKETEWAAGMVADIPRPWAGRLLSAWEKRRASFNPLVVTGEGTARRCANEQLRADVALMRPVSAALPLDASDSELCHAARNEAERCRVKLLAIEGEQEHARTDEFLDAIRAAGVCADAGAIDAFEQRYRLAALCAGGGIEPPEPARYADVPAVRRMVAAHWWKGRLRKAHGKARESAAIRLGYVGRGKECYVSSVSTLDRQWQNERNAAALAATIARNVETKQEFTLAELAAKGPGEKSIRRAELMTRINGFERIAIAAGHAGLFLTMTCPSSMHRMTTVGAKAGQSRANGEWDGTLPDRAQAHMSAVWARIRAALARHGVRLYGFRIAEPNHDGTPHWHFLIFHETLWPGDALRLAQPRIEAIVRRYALEIDGDTVPDKTPLVKAYRRMGPCMRVAMADALAARDVHMAMVGKRARENAQTGAKEKRCDFKRMDPAKGTAAGYIAKYVAKNIDGYRLEKDLEGNDSFETSARVEAWASRWRIRQFQQIGGPPVSVWRELRRVASVPGDAPAYVIAAHNAVNKVAKFEGRENASVAWDHYVNAQGGINCGRNYRVRIARMESDKVGRYGEQAAPVIVGIEYAQQFAYQEYRPVGEVEDRKNGLLIGVEVSGFSFVRNRTVTVESKRFTWEIIRKGATSGFGRAVRAASAFTSASADADTSFGPARATTGGLKGLNLGFKREHRAPWTCVNNCTGVSDGAEGWNGRNAGNAGKGVRKAADDRTHSGRRVFSNASRSDSSAGNGGMT
jgi:hypothetical protein